MLWAEHVTRNTARERDDVFTEVRQQFNDAELLELTMISGRFNASNRFQDTMCLPIEGQDEVDRIRRTVRADPNRIKAFIEKLIEYWPREFPVARSDEKTLLPRSRRRRRARVMPAVPERRHESRSRIPIPRRAKLPGSLPMPSPC